MPGKSDKKKSREPEIELHPNAWERFESGIRKLAKASPQHRQATPSRAKGASRKAPKTA